MYTGCFISINTKYKLTSNMVVINIKILDDSNMQSRHFVLLTQAFN